MAYEKLNLKTGQVITEDVFAHLEDGIATTANTLAEKADTTYVDSEIEKLAKEKIISFSYAEIKMRKEKGKLVAGAYYRITDYVTTVLATYGSSAKHYFDVVVLALDGSTFSERAWAVHSERSDYFKNAGANLAAWQIWYCFDNDTERFAWANSAIGTGVIYRMIDEWGNDCPYDFKNVLFTVYIDTQNDSAYSFEDKGFGLKVSAYTFSWRTEEGNIQDASLICNNGTVSDDVSTTRQVYNNRLSVRMGNLEDDGENGGNAFMLNRIVFFAGHAYDLGYFYGFYANTFKENCKDLLLNFYARANVFGNGVINSIINSCSYCSFGNSIVGSFDTLDDNTMIRRNSSNDIKIFNIADLVQ